MPVTRPSSTRTSSTVKSSRSSAPASLAASPPAGRRARCAAGSAPGPPVRRRGVPAMVTGPKSNEYLVMGGQFVASSCSRMPHRAERRQRLGDGRGAWTSCRWGTSPCRPAAPGSRCAPAASRWPSRRIAPRRRSRRSPCSRASPSVRGSSDRLTGWRPVRRPSLNDADRGIIVEALGGPHMAKDHGPSIKDDKQYEGLRKKGMSKSRAAASRTRPTPRARAGSAPAAAAAAAGAAEQRPRERRQSGAEGGRRTQGRQGLQLSGARPPPAPGGPGRPGCRPPCRS